MTFSNKAFLKSILRNTVIVFVMLLCSCNDKKESNPNIIIINIDDLGWRDLGFMGNTFHETPNIDHLASNSMIFTNAYASASNCAPSRASLFTGLYSNRHRIFTVGNSERGKSKDRRLIPIENKTILSDTFPIISTFLKSKGYHTCHSGKWHLNDNPLKMGFDFNIGGAANGHPKSYSAPFMNVNLEAADGERLTNHIMKKTLEFIHHTEKPFFLNYAPYAVHTPIEGVDSLKNKYENKEEKPLFGNIAYATMVDNLDDNIGRMMKLLENKGLLDNTIIFLTSDNGGLYGITDQAPLRAGKGSYYEGGIRVPMSVFWKGKIKAEVNFDPIIQIDLFPTIIDLIDEKSVINLDGLSLENVLLKGESLPERSIFWHFPIYLQAYNEKVNQNRDSLFRTRPGTVIRKGNWKLHYYYEDQKAELYDLDQDISETNDISKENPEIVQILMKEMDAWLNNTDGPIPREKNPEFLESFIK